MIPTAAAVLPEIVDALRGGPVEAWGLLSAIGGLALQIFFLILVGMAAWRLGWSLVKALFRGRDDESSGEGVRAELRRAS